MRHSKRHSTRHSKRHSKRHSTRRQKRGGVKFNNPREVDAWLTQLPRFVDICAQKVFRLCDQAFEIGQPNKPSRMEYDQDLKKIKGAGYTIKTLVDAVVSLGRTLKTLSHAFKSRFIPFPPTTPLVIRETSKDETVSDLVDELYRINAVVDDFNAERDKVIEADHLKMQAAADEHSRIHSRSRKGGKGWWRWPFSKRDRSPVSTLKQTSGDTGPRVSPLESRVNTLESRVNTLDDRSKSLLKMLNIVNDQLKKCASQEKLGAVQSEVTYLRGVLANSLKK